MSMRILVHAKPNAKEANVSPAGEGRLEVSVKEPPIQGRANRAIITALAEHFHVAPSRVQLVSGFASREKIFEIG